MKTKIHTLLKPINFGGEELKAGDPIELNEKQAAFYRNEGYIAKSGDDQEEVTPDLDPDKALGGDVPDNSGDDLKVEDEDAANTGDETPDANTNDEQPDFNPDAALEENADMPNADDANAAENADAGAAPTIDEQPAEEKPAEQPAKTTAKKPVKAKAATTAKKS